MPTQMPKNGRALTRTASVIVSQHAVNRIEARGGNRRRRRRPAARCDRRGAPRRDRASRGSSAALRMLARRALERLGRRVQIARAIIDDGDAHRDASRLRKQSDEPRCGSGWRLRDGWPGRAGRRRRAAIAEHRCCPAALPCGPAIEEAPLGGFLVIGHDDIELAPAAPRQRPAQRCRLRSPEQHEQSAATARCRHRGRAEHRRATLIAASHARSSRSARATAVAQASQNRPKSNAQK